VTLNVVSRPKQTTWLAFIEERKLWRIFDGNIDEVADGCTK